MISGLRQLYWTTCYYFFLLCFAVGIYTVNLCSLLLSYMLKAERAQRVLQAIVHQLLRFYIWLMIANGMLHTNCDLLKRLLPGNGGRLIVANHPSILDAPIFLSRIPGLLCVYKSSLKKSFTMSRTASTLGYLSNDEGIVLLKEMSNRLKSGHQVLVFPEGTRTTGQQVNNFNPGYALAALRAGVPVQLVRIRPSSPILGKELPFYKVTAFPVEFHFDIGPCIDPGSFMTVKQFNAFVEDWYRDNLNNPRSIKCPLLPSKHDVENTPEGTLITRFKVPESPIYCHGHMKDRPIVPGYAQMMWVREILNTATGINEPMEFFRWKFLQPVIPGDAIEIRINPIASKPDILILSNDQPATTGKLITEKSTIKRN